MANLFSKFFSTPKFLTTPAVGLDISDRSIHFAELVPGKSGYVLGRHGYRKMPPGIVEFGDIKDAAGLKRILSSISRGSGIAEVNVSIPEKHVRMMRMFIPRFGGGDLRAAIGSRMEEFFPLKAGEAVFDYEIISESADGYDVEVSALPKSAALEYLEIYKGTGLEPVSFEPKADAIARAAIPRNDRGTKMIVNLGEVRTLIAVVSNGVVMRAEVINAGGRVISGAVGKRLNVSLEEAERMKNRYGLSKTPAGKQFSSIISEPLSELKDEINKHFIDWHISKDPGGGKRERIKSIILSGGDSDIPGLADYLSANLKVPVSLINIWTNVNSFENYIPEINFKDSLWNAAAVGLALKSIKEND